MSIIWKWFCGIALLIPIIAIVIGNLFRCWYRIKCFKVKECSNKQCRYKSYCSKYHEAITEEDKEKIQKLIDQL